MHYQAEKLQDCHRIKKKDRVSIKFECKKQKNRVLFNRKTQKIKYNQLTQLNYHGKLFISESMCNGNRHLVYKLSSVKFI